jgi:Ribosome biogenesis protein Nop16
MLLGDRLVVKEKTHAVPVQMKSKKRAKTPTCPKALAAYWNFKKSAAWNYANIGLSKDPNHHRPDLPNLPEKSPDIKLFDVPPSDKPSSRSQHPLSKKEEEYIVKCMEKYGDDYVRMFRDIKTNDMQHTEERLRTWGSRYILLTPEQRHCEIPEKVKHLIPGYTE